MGLPRTDAEKLPVLKKYVENWHQYFKYNHQRWWDFTKFVCATNISSKERAALQALQKPPLQFNILEAQISRLCGEFAKHKPSFDIRAMDGAPVSMLTPEFTKTLDIIEGYLLGMFADNTSDSLKYKFYRDLLIGGFSVGEVITRYVNARSFEQVIEVERVFDPTLTIFDPMARLSHKGDGEYCGKLEPLTYDDFIDEFGTKASEYVHGDRHTYIEGFNWSYLNQQQETVLTASIFCKVRKKIKIVKLTNGHTVPLDHYEKLLDAWDEELVMAQPPRILKERKTYIETLERYKICGEKILDRVDTNFTMFPLIFIDGNSVLIKGQDVSNGNDSYTDSGADSDNGATQQMTKPYVMHARDAQLLMNFAGQSLAGEMENIVQHQYIVAVEAVPDDQQAAYTNPQIASCLQYNHVFDKEAGIMLPPPQVLQRREIPPVLESTFLGAAGQMQTILGNYDAILGVNDKEISGAAIQQGALQSNAAAIPYLVGFTNGLNRMADVIVDLIPKYYNTPRTLPIVKSDGKRDYQIINSKRDPNSVFLDYDPKNLMISVEMGVSAEVQKQVALNTLIKLSAASEDWANFIGAKGGEVILDNLDIRGIDHLKELYAEYQQEKQQAAQQPPPPTDAQIVSQAEIEKTQIEAEVRREGQQLDAANKAADLAIKQSEVDRKFLELMAKIESDDIKAIIEREKQDSENSRASIELAMKMISDLGKGI